MRRHRAFMGFILAFCLVASAIAKSQVISLDEENWRLMLEKEWMVEFYAPWCPACKSLAPTWDEFSTWSDDLSIKTAKIDVTTSPALSGRFFVTALPTIFHVLNGEFRQYRGARDLNSLMSFIEEKKWKSLEPVSSWKKPDSVQMSVVSYFFKLSHYLKEVNNRLLQDYGLPAWGSYAIFAIATIFLGAVLGLLLVCIIDFLYPPKNIHRQSFSESKERIKVEDDAIEEIAGDELEDEDEIEDEEEDEGSTSEGEKNSESDSEAPESDKKKSSSPDADDAEGASGDNEEVGNSKEKSSSPEVRKRKPRKAD